MTGDLYRRAARQFIYPCSTIGHYTTWCNVEQAGFPLLMDVQHRLYREEGSVIQANEGWPMILDAMSKCKAMIIYARKIKEWPNCRGLVEVGVALSNGIPIFISCPEVQRWDRRIGEMFGDWIGHPEVMVIDNLMGALYTANGLDG